MDEGVLPEQLGATVRRLRLERGYSQAEFSGACNLERAYMGMIERGEVNISVKTALKISRGLGLGLSTFFYEVERKPQSS